MQTFWKPFYFYLLAFEVAYPYPLDPAILPLDVYLAEAHEQVITKTYYRNIAALVTIFEN